MPLRRSYPPDRCAGWLELSNAKDELFCSGLVVRLAAAVWSRLLLPVPVHQSKRATA